MVKSTRKTRKAQKGGFYPSVFEGIRGAALLTPLAMRQAYRLWGNSSASTKRRSRATTNGRSSGTRRRKSKRTRRTAKKTRSSLKHRVLPAK